MMKAGVIFFSLILTLISCFFLSSSVIASDPAFPLLESELTNSRQAKDQSLEEMFAQIDAATEIFKGVADKKLEDKVVEMDGIIGLIDKLLASLSDGGELDKELKRTEENRRKILADVEAKWLDAKNNATTRAKWELEIAKNRKLLDELALQRVLLGEARAEIESQRQLVIEEKELFVYYIANEELNKAHDQLVKLIQIFLGTNEATSNVAVSGGSEAGE